MVHRSLNEEVLNSALEEACGELAWHRQTSPAGRRAWQAPLMAMALGALLVLALQRSGARGRAGR